MSERFVATVPNDPVGESADPLRPSTCPNCGYALAGLPDAGTCPECGGRYDRNDGLTLFGTAAGKLVNATNMSGREALATAAWWLAGALVLAWFQWRTNGFGSGAGLVGVLVVQGARLVVRAAAWGLSNPRATVRVRLTGDGVVQQDLSPASPLVERAASTCVGLTLVGLAAWLFVRTGHADAAGAGPLALAAVVTVGLVVLVVRRADVVTRAGAWLRFGPSVATREGRPHPWAVVDEVKLTRTAGETYRLAISRRGTWAFDRTLVDAHVRLTAAQAAEVGHWINVCRRSVA